MAEYIEVAALVVLPSLLPDSRVKVDITKVVQLAKVRVYIVHVNNTMCIS